MAKAILIQTIRAKYESIRPILHKRGRSIGAATEAQHIGRGGICIVEEAIGMSHSTIRRGAKEIQSGTIENLPQERSRCQGGGRRNIETIDTDIHQELDALVDPVKKFLNTGQPVVSVDTKKKPCCQEKGLGNDSNKGREYRPKKSPLETNTHDFPHKELGKAIPYGVYDIGRNEGWVSLGMNHDTSQFAANSIRRWWMEMGQYRFGQAKRLLITAEAGGSNRHRTK